MNETPTPPPGTPPFGKSPEADAKENRDIAALGYAWALSIFVYMWKKDSPFVRFHAKQGIVLFVLSILFWPIPYVGRFFELLILALCVLGFLNAAQAQWKDLPIISDIASGRWTHVRQSLRDIGSLLGQLMHRIHPKKEKKPETPKDSPPPPATGSVSVMDTTATVVPAESAVEPSVPDEAPVASPAETPAPQEAPSESDSNSIPPASNVL